MSTFMIQYQISLSAIATASNGLMAMTSEKAAPATRGDTATVGNPGGGIHV
jgi:hypothetical protein